MKFYALMLGNGSFTCRAETKEKHEFLVDKAWWNWRGVQSKGTSHSKEDYLRRIDAKPVIVTVEEQS